MWTSSEEELFWRYTSICLLLLLALIGIPIYAWQWCKQRQRAPHTVDIPFEELKVGSADYSDSCGGQDPAQETTVEELSISTPVANSVL